MVEGKKRSRTLRRVKVKTPGGKTITHYRMRKPGKAQCRDCGAYMAGIPHVIRSVLRNLTRSQKRPTRPYAGNLCGKCLRILNEKKVMG
ncbi:MAG: 50S ribosomal protein L34e [Candidatus Woesearchaeota archaeon]|jgi:large subunit ribosomal protein L34e|nr:50S ribosomal protein L34e [Candidatus Woesearchaeota archaeon]MDP7180889.1 50S ribosomal protein L34e [Candidatus Woesearchaeota archaeon]MDP7199173.1 50S ribosomal protein L34e [Candidatus Woesearchaeota archaeon]MDP7467564.1 50S ribosomal protein L34e [Candidatus Woesearchaeota archaeon]MDP7647046.1 50S ribosomal protein L34e [Candidatus Woesearchaeota archaeon]